MASTDRGALIALFNATGGTGWARNKNWNTGADLARWDGVEVNDQGRVVKLSLSANNLRGAIPPELGDLAVLNELLLGKNQLSGPIPATRGKLAALETLSLCENQLTGAIPPELGDLAVLKDLSLWGNELSGPIPATLGKLAALKMLVFSNNQLTEIPPEVLELIRANQLMEDWNLWHGNPLSRPPLRVLSSGLESALGWWNDVKRFGQGESNKLKMVLVGLENAGKTTIVRHLTGGSAPGRAGRTVGIEITPEWKPSKESRLQVSVWDFAGQADYYASHQLFLTEGALFLLVVDLRKFSTELESDADNFTDTGRCVYWWLDMLHMRVPGAAVALVGSHVDQMTREEAARASSDLHTVATNFIQEKDSNSARTQSIRGIDAESTTTSEVDHARECVQHVTLRDSFAQRSGSSKSAAKALILHDDVFKVSDDRESVLELRQWIVKAAYGRECPPEFNFPAVDQIVPKAWVTAYDAMGTLGETKPYVLWSRAVEEFRKRMGAGGLEADEDTWQVLLRAMKHREAEGGVLLSLKDASAPVATDMLHLDPSWLMALVRRLSDHNLVSEDERKRGTVYKELRSYAKKVDRVKMAELVDMHSAYCKSGRLNRDFLRFLWMHRKIGAKDSPIHLSDAEFETVVSTMARLLVMYKARGADILVVPARLEEYGDHRIVDTMQDVVMTIECSFGLVFPPPGVVGRFIARSAQQVGNCDACWQHGAFFSYKFQHAQYKVFLYEKPVEELYEDGTKRNFAGLVLGIQGPPVMAVEVLDNLRESLETLVSDPVLGYPGIAEKGDMYFAPPKIRESKFLDGLRSTLDNMNKRLDRIDGIVSQLLEQDLLAASGEPSEYPHRVLVRPEVEDEDFGPPEVIQHAGWDRWTKALSDIGSHKFRLHFLCEHDSSVVPCGPEGRGYLIEQPKEWVKKWLPLMQGSLWVLRVAVGALSHVDLPLDEVLGAFVKATGAELVASMSNVTESIGSAAIPKFGEGATQNEIDRFIHLRGTAYKALCDFMPGVESPGCLPGCLPRRRTRVVDWRKNMDRVQNPRTRRWAWVLRGNKDAYVRKHGGILPTTRAPPS